MKKLFLILILVISSFYTTFSQLDYSLNPLVAYFHEGKWTILNGKGNEMFSFGGNHLLAGYSEGLFLFKRKIDGKIDWAFYDHQGKEKFSVNYDEVLPLQDGMSLVWNNTTDTVFTKLMGFINKKGEEIVAPKYLDATQFTQGRAYVMNNDDRGYIGKDGKYIFKLDFIGYDFSEGIAAISNNEYKVGYIDTSGNIKIPFTFDEPSTSKEGLIRANKRNKIGFINHYGNFVLDAIYDDARNFSEGYTFVCKFNPVNNNQVWALIDKNANPITDYFFMKVNDFSESYATVRTDDSWIFIDKSGRKQFNTNYDFADNFKYGLAWASKIDENKFGFINTYGEWKITIPKADVIWDLRFNKQVHIDD